RGRRTKSRGGLGLFRLARAPPTNWASGPRSPASLVGNAFPRENDRRWGCRHGVREHARLMIHPTAVIHPHAEIDPSVEIGPYTVIESGVMISAGCRIGPFVHLVGATSVGANNHFHAGCVIGDAPQDLKYEGEVTRLVIGEGNVFREHVTAHRSNCE